MERRRVAGASRRGGSGLLAAGLLVLTGLSGCGGDPEDGPERSAAPTTTPPTAAAPVVTGPPAGHATPDVEVELTPPGTDLAAGETGTVAHQAGQQPVAVLDLTVLALEKASWKQFTGWRVDDDTRAMQPYFVTVGVENLGSSDLAGREVPLYALDAAGRLVQATTFATPFERCPSTGLPESFTTGAATAVCLVYLVPEKGDLEGVSYRPAQEFEPITWSGEVTRAGARPVKVPAKFRPRQQGGKKNGPQKQQENEQEKNEQPSASSTATG